MKIKLNLKIESNQIIQFLSLFFVSIIFRYYLPKFGGDVFFAGLVVLFLRSNNNYFWLPLFLLLFDPPGGLFNPSSLTFSLPGIAFGGGGREIPFSEMFVVATFLKVYQIRKLKKFFFSTPFVVLAAYLIFLLFVSFILGTTFLRALKMVRHILPFLMFFSIPRLLPTCDDYYKLFELLFIASIVLFGAQIYDLVTGSKIAFLFGETAVQSGFGNLRYANETMDINSGINRVFYGPTISLLCMLGAMYFISLKDKTANNKYYYFILLLNFLMVILSGTRGWILSYSTMVILFYLFVLRNPFSLIKQGLLSAIVFILLLVYFPSISKQIEYSFERFQTVKALARGDLTADHTLIRLDVRGPRVLNKFWERPVFGFAFSQEFYQYADQHVGHHTLLLNGGIVGYALFLFFWIYFNLFLYFKNKHLQNNNLYKDSLFVFIIIFIGIFIIHSSSAMIFGFFINVPMGIMLALVFCFTDTVYKESQYLEHAIKAIQFQPLII